MKTRIPELAHHIKTDSLFTVYAVRNDVILRLGVVRAADLEPELAEARTRGRALTGVAIVWQAATHDDEVRPC